MTVPSLARCLGPAERGSGVGADARTLQVLDFFRILEALAEEGRSPQGKALCAALRPLPDAEAARRALAEVEELGRREPDLGLPPVGGLREISAHLKEARRPGVTLAVEALLEIRDTVETCARVLEYLEDAAAEGSPLGEYAARMRPLDLLVDRFARTFGPRGEILDGASPQLAAIRAELRRLRQRIRSRLEALLRERDLAPAVQDDFVTVRDGRYVVPLRTDFRGYLDGIVHDRSRTGNTFFVEPLEVVELNNRLGSLREEEEAEIRRILADLTAQVGREAGAVAANVAVAAHLDLVSAKWGLARRLGAVRPEIVDRPELRLDEARHPLLVLHPDHRVVPVDLRVGGEGEEGPRLLLITGANAGGKTVALKTAGLLTLMARSGLFVPAAEGSRVGWFDPVFADIGDEQDLDRHLSTFTGHVARLREALEGAAPGTLVLLDELGAGTDPREGAALALAVLVALMEAGATVIGTTHLEGLKGFAYARAEAENAAVAFDRETGRPLYRLIYGRTGRSNALDVAERLGFPPEVLARARAYAAGGEEPGAGFLRDLERARDEALEALARARAAEEEARGRLAEVERRLREAEEARRRAREEAWAEARAEIARARRALARVIRRFARREIPQKEAEAEVARVAQTLERALVRPAPEPSRGAEPLREGLWVRVRSLGREGRIVELKDGQAVVDVGGLRVTVAPAQLEVRGEAPRAPEARGGGVRVEAEARAPTDLVLVGCRVDEALRRLDRALDGAVLAGAGALRVVHGRGTGALRRAVRERLSSDPRVGGWQAQEGDAVTVVELRG
ncbi:endonuclease MutS2 [Deferrisoma camini]|uniref:endonuclease MutS2 n=1 Tax=Deferrisoma camini TaxID=1035120 RepID=UPI00046CDCBC|nr:endonuclease MutS2 [Deferrisoma camini]